MTGVLTEILVAEIKREITRYVERTDWVSQGELANRLGHDLVYGDEAMVVDAANIVLMINCSPQFIEATKQLLAEKVVKLAPCSMLALMCDGCPIPLKMKIANKPPKGGYKEPRFLPVCFRPASVT